MWRQRVWTEYRFGSVELFEHNDHNTKRMYKGIVDSHLRFGWVRKRMTEMQSTSAHSVARRSIRLDEETHD